jgi:hypothetical protein
MVHYFVSKKTTLITMDILTSNCPKGQNIFFMPIQMGFFSLNSPIKNTMFFL